MDPALRKEKEAFKKRALAATEKSQEIRREKGKASSSNSSAQHKIKKVKKKRTRTFESSGKIKYLSKNVLIREYMYRSQRTLIVSSRQLKLLIAQTILIDC